jgi:hypothetical protein
LIKIVYMALVFIGVCTWILWNFLYPDDKMRIMKRIVKKIKNIFKKKYHDE